MRNVDTAVLRAIAKDDFESWTDKHDLLNAAADLIDACRAAGFIDDAGQVRKVLGTLPLTGDGAIIGQGSNLWYKLPCGSSTEIVSMTHTPYIEPHQPAFSTREAALAASQKGAAQ